MIRKLFQDSIANTTEVIVASLITLLIMVIVYLIVTGRTPKLTR